MRFESDSVQDENFVMLRNPNIYYAWTATKIIDITEIADSGIFGIHDLNRNSSGIHIQRI